MNASSGAAPPSQDMQANPSRPGPSRELKLFTFLVAAIVLFGVNMASPLRSSTDAYGPGIKWTKAEAPELWPYKDFDHGVVRCAWKNVDGDRIQGPAVTIQLGATIYGLNGTAKAMGGYPEDSGLYATDGSGYRTIGNPLPIISKARENCPP